MKVLEKFENIICPICNGNGKIQCSKRLNCYEDQSWEEKCNYCNGKRCFKNRHKQTYLLDCEVENGNKN